MTLPERTVRALEHTRIYFETTSKHTHARINHKSGTIEACAYVSTWTYLDKTAVPARAVAGDSPCVCARWMGPQHPRCAARSQADARAGQDRHAENRHPPCVGWWVGGCGYFEVCAGSAYVLTHEACACGRYAFWCKRRAFIFACGTNVAPSQDRAGPPRASTASGHTGKRWKLEALNCHGDERQRVKVCENKS